MVGTEGARGRQSRIPLLVKPPCCFRLERSGSAFTGELIRRARPRPMEPMFVARISPAQPSEDTSCAQRRRRDQQRVLVFVCGLNGPTRCNADCCYGLDLDPAMRPATVYLFQCGHTDQYALSIDVTGCILPSAHRTWVLRGDLEPKDFPAEFTPALKHLAQHGFDDP